MACSCLCTDLTMLVCRLDEELLDTEDELTELREDIPNELARRTQVRASGLFISLRAVGLSCGLVLPLLLVRCGCTCAFAALYRRTLRCVPFAPRFAVHR